MNIGEIASLAGVSKAAVSRYFNQGYISEEKKEAIRKVVEETGYQPSTQAQTLRTKKTRTIGVIVPKINSDSVGRVVEGISTVLDENGYQILLGNTYNSLNKELEYLRLFNEKRVDGILFLATMITAKHKKIMKELEVPIIIIGQQVNGYNCVYHDDYFAVKEMTKEILLKKAQKIGYIGVTREDIAVGAKREDGYLDAMKEYGIAVLDLQKVISDFSMEGGYAAMHKLFVQKPDVEAVICATDNIAIGAMHYLQECGRRIPEDVMITGVGDSRVARVTTPTITTIHYYYKTSGVEAATMLVQILDGKTFVRELKMGYKIIEQQSTDKKTDRM